MAVVNRVPRGLLGLLDAKTQGQTPADTTGVLSPVIDLTANYLADLVLETGQASSNATLVAGQNYGVVTVPDAELWYIYHVTSQIIADSSGDSLDCSPVLVTPSGVVPVFLCNSLSRGFSTSSGAVGDTLPSGVTYGNPLLVGPGTRFATQVFLQTAGTRTAVTSVIYRSVSV